MEFVEFYLDIGGHTQEDIEANIGEDVGKSGNRHICYTMHSLNTFPLGKSCTRDTMHVLNTFPVGEIM